MPPLPPDKLPQPDARLRRIDLLGYLLDDAIRIPVLGYRIGWDAIIGLIPGVGDVAGFVLSAYIVFEASRFGLPKATLLRMVVNVVIEALLGVVPFLGDVFDATWKANARNLDLLHAHLGEEGERRRKVDRRFAFGMLAVLVGLVAVLGLLLFLTAEALKGLLGG